MHQELSMVENLAVAENVFLAREPVGCSGLVDAQRMNEQARQVLDLLELHIAPTASMSELGVGRNRLRSVQPNAPGRRRRAQPRREVGAAPRPIPNAQMAR